MITYKTLESGSLSGNGTDFIPLGHEFYAKALAQVNTGEAEILPYTEPTLTPLQLRNIALANITYTRPSDGAEIQIRHPDYASDYIMINSAISRMEPLDTRVWIKVDNIPTLVSKEDLEAVITHGVAEVDRIFSEYFVALGGA